VKLRRKKQDAAETAQQPTVAATPSASDAKPDEAKAAAETKPETDAKAESKDAKDASAAAAAAAPAASATDLRVDGLRAWIAQVDRKLGVRTYAGAAAVVLALAAGLAGAYLGVTAKDDSATTEELEVLRQQVEQMQAQSTATEEEGVDSVTQRLDELESRLESLSKDQSTTQSELDVVQDDIEELRGRNGRGSGNK